LGRIVRPGRNGTKKGITLGPQAQGVIAARRMKLIAESNGTKRGKRNILRRRRLLSGLRNVEG